MLCVKSVCLLEKTKLNRDIAFIFLNILWLLLLDRKWYHQLLLSGVGILIDQLIK